MTKRDPLLLDVTKEEQVKAAVETVKKRLQQDDRKLLGVINNAGYGELCPAEIATPDVFRQQYETSVLGPISVAQHFLPLLRDFASTSPSHRARLVFVSSIAGRFASAGHAPYASSKYAIEAIADSMRMELSKWKVAVILMEPCVIGTQIFGPVTASQKKRFSEARALLEKGQFPAGGAVLESYVRSGEKMLQGMKKLPMESVEWTSDALECAMLDSQPLSRYTAGWTSLPTYIFIRLPTELYDAAMGRDFR